MTDTPSTREWWHDEFDNPPIPVVNQGGIRLEDVLREMEHSAQVEFDRALGKVLGLLPPTITVSE